MNTQDLIAFLNRKSRHQATLASQATTSEAAFIHEDEAKRFAECAAQLAAAEQQLPTATALLGECEPHLEQYLDLVDDCSGKIPTPQLGSLLTRIRAATKGTQ